MAFLDDLLSSTREAIQSARRNRPLRDLRNRIRDRDAPLSLKKALSGKKGPGLIAEIKQASPSKGILRPDFKPLEIARIYEEEGARAISVLTEERFFRGSLGTLEAVRKTVSLPLLRKDFILDEYQIYEARAFGADAVLLIAAVLDDSRLKDYQALAHDLSMDALVEVHVEGEAERAVAADAGLIGINNRDLTTFKTDLETTFRLLKTLSGERMTVSESGIGTRKDIQRLEDAGVAAVLIGETFMKSTDIGGKIRELFGPGGDPPGN
ncbi:MAG TPA: indole-3-glycerol phosphate synthase TrpC [Nitrospiria bacterium]